jgi:hypothetical protein
MKLGTIQYNPTKNTAQLKAREVGMAAQTFQSEKQLFDTVGQITGQLADKFSKIEQQEAQLEYKQKLLATEEKLASQDTFTKTDLLSMGLTELDKNVDWSKETFKSYEIQSAVMRQAMKDGVEDAVGKVGIPSYRGDLRRQLEGSNLNTMKALAADTAAQAERHLAKTDKARAMSRGGVEDNQWRTVIADLDSPEDLMKVEEYLQGPESRENTYLTQQDRDVLANKSTTKAEKIVRDLTAAGLSDVKAMKQMWPVVEGTLDRAVGALDAEASMFKPANEQAYAATRDAIAANKKALLEKFGDDATLGTKLEQVRDKEDALFIATEKSRINLMSDAEATAYVDANHTGEEYRDLMAHVNAQRVEATKTAPTMAIAAGVIDNYDDLEDPLAIDRMRKHFGVYDVAVVSPKMVEYFEAQFDDVDNMSSDDFIDMAMSAVSIPGLVNQLAPTKAINKTVIAVAGVYDEKNEATWGVAKQILKGSRNDAFKGEAASYSTGFQSRYGNSFATAEEKNAAFDAAYNYMKGDLSGETTFEQAMDAAAPPLALLGGTSIPISVGLSADGFNTHFTKVLRAEDVKGVDNFTPQAALKHIRRGHLIHIGDNRWEVGLASDPQARMTVDGEPLVLTYGVAENAAATSFYMKDSRGIYGEATRRGNRSKYGARTPGDAAVPSRKPR